MRDTMRDGRANRSASNRSKAPKAPLVRVGTTSSRPALSRAPSSVDATLAAEVAIDRHGTPMHSASIKPRKSPPKPQPIRRPTRNTIAPSTIFEDVDLEMNSGSMNSSSLGSYSTEQRKYSNDSYSTGPRKYSYSASDDASRFRTERHGTGQRSPLPRAMATSATSNGCLAALKSVWVLWKEIDRLGGPSQEALAITFLCKKFDGGGKERDVERNPRQAVPQLSTGRKPYSRQDFQLRQLSAESNRGNRGQNVPTIVDPRPAAATAGPQRIVLQRKKPGSVTSQSTTWGQFQEFGKAPSQTAAPSGPGHEVRNDTPQRAEEPARDRTNYRRGSPSPAVCYPSQAQAPYLDENRNFNREEDVDQGSFIHGFDNFDGAYRPETMMSGVTSSYGANMSYADPNDWESIASGPRPRRFHNHSPAAASSFYSTTTNGHPIPYQARLGSPRPSMPHTPGEYSTHLAPPPPIFKTPWRESQPVSPMSVAYPSLVGDHREPISPLQQRDSYQHSGANWEAHQNREKDGQSGQGALEVNERRESEYAESTVTAMLQDKWENIALR